VDTFDAIVIGAGEAGSEVANRAVQAGYRVALIYRPPFGSTCLNAGCTPSKFLIHRARVAHIVRSATRYHVDAAIRQIRLADIVREMNTLLDAHRRAAFDAARRAPSLALIEAQARFHSDHVVDAGDQRLYAPRVFIATGLRADIPDTLALDSARVHTSDSIMRLTSPPQRLVVIGGGYVACELGQTYRRFGSEVTIVQSGTRLLGGEEEDASTVLERAFEAEGIQLLLGHRAVRLDEHQDAIRVVVRNRSGAERALEASHLLIATGRRPNTDSLALDAAGVAVNAKGFVRVNDRLETNVQGIWAIGDVNGEQPFTRVCQEEGRVAYANAFEGRRLTLDRRAFPHAVFCDPEIGSVGYTEAAARALGIDVSVGLVTVDQVVKAQLIGETAGLIKYVIDRKSRQLIGCHVVGPNAADLVYDAALVMRHNGTLDEIGSTVGVFRPCKKAWRAPQEHTSGHSLPARRAVRSLGSHRKRPLWRHTSMAETKDFTCRACGAQFDSRDKLDQHNKREHGTQGTEGGSSGQQYGEGQQNRGTGQQFGDRGPNQGGSQTGSQGSRSTQGGQQGQPSRPGEGAGQQGQRGGQQGQRSGSEGYGEGTQRGGVGEGSRGGSSTNEPGDRDKRAGGSSTWGDEEG